MNFDQKKCYLIFSFIGYNAQGAKNLPIVFLLKLARLDKPGNGWPARRIVLFLVTKETSCGGTWDVLSPALT